MIRFACPACQRAFKVSGEHAGRTARCKRCGAELRVPQVAPSAPSAMPASMVLPMRTRRLMADADQIRRAFATCDWISVEPIEGNPPEVYRVEYRIGGLEAGTNGQPRPRRQHRAEIRLTSQYPRISPQCRMLTPIFHPNIDSATICVGDHWAAGERLVDLVIRIGEMIAYQAYNIKSPLNGEAAMWADLHPRDLPTDNRDLRPGGME